MRPLENTTYENGRIVRDTNFNAGLSISSSSIALDFTLKMKEYILRKNISREEVWFMSQIRPELFPDTEMGKDMSQDIVWFMSQISPELFTDTESNFK